MTTTTDEEIRSFHGIPFSGPMVKGEYGGLCNVTACQKPGAIYYNHSTRKFYCPVCAERINDANRADAQAMFGHDLCTAPLWHICFANESGAMCECYVDAYDPERAERAWVKGDYDGYREVGAEGEYTWDYSSDEENIYSIERDGETGDLKIR